MLKRLRKKFIIVTMGSVLAVLVLIVGTINIVSYANVVKNADRIVGLLIDNGGSFGDKDPNEQPPAGDPIGMPGKPPSPETPYETRFFTVVLDDDGTVQFVDTDRIAAVDEKEAAAYAVKLYATNKTAGFYGNYRFGAAAAENGRMYVLVDCTKELTSFRNFLFVSAAVGAAAFLSVFILVFFLSGKVMKPIAESYSKQKRFITDASHEIKTPLTVIGAAAEVLEIQGTSNEWTRSIREQVKRLTQLTERLVFLARMDEESQILKATDFSFSDAVEETIKPFYAVAVSRGLGLECAVQKDISYCGDETLVRQLISLLMDNALKYSDDGGTVRVRLKTAGGKAQLTVSNPAKEMSGDLRVLFERFYRTDRSRNSETGGYGIGLSVAKAIVEAHKGKITAQAENGTVVFTVIL